MKPIVTITFLACILTVVSCVKPKEPQARICPDDPIVITTSDTLELDNCSDNYESQRWTLPAGVFSTQNKVAIASPTPLSYLLKLSVRNSDYSRDYTAERKVKIISKFFTTSTINATLTAPTDEITVCTVVDDIDASDPDGYYTSKGAPAGYDLVADLGNGCYKYALTNPNNPPSGSAITYHYFCVDVEGGYCDTTEVVLTAP